MCNLRLLVAAKIPLHICIKAVNLHILSEWSRFVFQIYALEILTDDRINRKSYNDQIYIVHYKHLYMSLRRIPLPFSKREYCLILTKITNKPAEFSALRFIHLESYLQPSVFEIIILIVFTVFERHLNRFQPFRDSFYWNLGLFLLNPGVCVEQNP